MLDIAPILDGSVSGQNTLALTHGDATVKLLNKEQLPAIFPDAQFSTSLMVSDLSCPCVLFTHAEAGARILFIQPALLDAFIGA